MLDAILEVAGKCASILVLNATKPVLLVLDPLAFIFVASAGHL